jgi:predicted permease
MALLVLVAAGLLARSFVALQRVPVGFSPEHVVAYQVTLPFAKYDSATKVLNFFDQVRARTLEIPGVAEVSGVYPLPMAGDGWSGTFSVDGEPEGPSVPLPHAELAVAMPGYFHAARIPIIAGREFDATDRRDSPPVVVVDEALARKHWPGESAIGKRVNLDLPAGQWATVIGVVGHVHNAGPQAEGEPQLYLPLTQHPQRTVSIVARTNAAPSTILSPIRAVVKSLDPQMPISRFASLENFVSRALAKQRFNTLLLAIFAATALVLSSVGLYGVMSFLVSQRSREIGIRMALGGQIGAIRGMVLREGILIALTGLAVGVVVSLALGKMLSGLLFGVAATDTATYITISALLLAVGCAASYGPARRATRVDPVAALRE